MEKEQNSKQKKVSKKNKQDEEPIREINIRVIGIGGGGGLIVSGLSSSLKKVLFAVLNTDTKAVEDISKENKIKGITFGSQLTEGLGTGMDPELGKKAAEKDIEEVRPLFKEQDIVIFVTSLGGGTGSGALPVFASAAKEEGALVYGVFTLPFSFEGDKKMRVAKTAIKETNPYLHAVTILPNEKIFEIVDKNTPLKEALAVMNENLANSLGGLVETIYETGLINIDFADVKTVLGNKKGIRKLTYLNTAQGTLEEGVSEVVKRAVLNPLYPYTISNAKGVLFNITGGKDIGLTDISSISENIYRYTGNDARVILGIKQKNNYKNKVKVSILATGCESELFVEELTEEEKKGKTGSSTSKDDTTKKTKKNSSAKSTSAGKEKKKENKKKGTQKKEETVTVVPSEGGVPEEEKAGNPENEEEKEILEEEKKWERPSFLRRLK